MTVLNSVAVLSGNGYILADRTRLSPLSHSFIPAYLDAK
jgi:hypothetical protein